MSFPAEFDARRFFAAWRAPDEEMWVWDRIHACLIWMSSGLSELFDSTLQAFEADPHHWLERLEASQQESVRATMATLMPGQPLQYEYAIAGIQLRHEQRLLALNGDLFEVNTVRELATAPPTERALMSDTLQITGIGGWELILPDGEIHLTPEVYAIYGISPNLPVTYDTALLPYLPESRARLEAAARRALADGTPFDLELEFRRKNDEPAWVRTCGRAQVDAGQVVRLYGSFQDITRQRRAEAGLHKLSLVAEKIPSMVVMTDAAFGIDYANQAYLQETGYSIEELRGQSPLFLQGEHTDPLTLTRIVKALVQKREVREEILFYTRQGQPFWCELAITPVAAQEDQPACYIVLQTNITQRKQREDLLLFQADILSHVNDAILVSDLDGRISYWSPGAEKTFGYRMEDMIGQPVVSLSPDLDPLILLEQRERSGAPALPQQEVLCRHKHGEGIWVGIRMDVIYSVQRVPLGVIGVARDISDAKRLLEDKNQLIQELTGKNEDLSQFTYIVSHNVRAPVANLKGLLSMLALDGQDSLQMSRLWEHFSQTVARLDETILDLNNILDIRRHRHEISQPLNLGDELSRALANLAGQTPGLRDWVRSELDVIACISVRSYIQSMFYNLLSNAVKYRHPERQPEILVRSGRCGEQIWLEVQDNGLGLDMSRVRDKICRLYMRFHPHIEGKGLGLFLVKTQAEALGGGIEVSGEPDQGTCIRVSFLDEAVVQGRGEDTVTLLQGEMG